MRRILLNPCSSNAVSDASGCFEGDRLKSSESLGQRGMSFGRRSGRFPEAAEGREPRVISHELTSNE